MIKNAKILVLGGRGLVGTTLVQQLLKQGYENVISLGRQELDLLNQKNVTEYFSQQKPEFVFFAAAKVGGIKENIESPANFILENLTIQNNVFNAVASFPPKKLIFFGSNCIYPSSVETSIQENQLLTGPIESTNESYAIAKIAGIKTLEAMRRQFNYNFTTVIPACLYGPNDLFDSEKSHVISGLISRMTKAMNSNDSEFCVWGSGKVFREFLFVEDLAIACIKLMESGDTHPAIINIGSGEEISIKDLVIKIQMKLGFTGKIYFDTNKPDGVKRKFLNSSYINEFGWKPITTIDEGLNKTISWYQA
jgi:GDP-L-fucose synthase